MPNRISRNLRFNLWKQRIPRDQWIAWVATRGGLEVSLVRALLEDRAMDSQLGHAECAQLARALGMEGDEETLRFADLVCENCDVLRENLAFLTDALTHGGKKILAAKLSVNPTTISRWLNGTNEPSEATLQQIATYFGVSAVSSLRTDPVFLSLEPVSLTERKQWLLARMKNMTTQELNDLYPALRRLLGSQ